MKMKNEIKEKIGLRRYLTIIPSIHKAEQIKPRKTYHVTNDKKILEHKKIIEKEYKNLKIMTPEQWQIHAYKKLNKKDKEKVKEKLEKTIERGQKK